MALYLTFRGSSTSYHFTKAGSSVFLSISSFSNHFSMDLFKTLVKNTLISSSREIWMATLISTRSYNYSVYRVTPLLYTLVFFTGTITKQT